MTPEIEKLERRYWWLTVGLVLCVAATVATAILLFLRSQP